jgi:hypothetical protein
MHFTVLVKGEDVEELLAPYQENNMGTCPEEFMEFEPLSLSDHGYSTHAEAIADGQPEKDGKAGYYHNPNSQWDWYVIGGRWNGFFLLKNGLHADQAFKEDIDFEGRMNKAEEDADKLYDQVIKIFGELEPHKPWSEFVGKKYVDVRNEYYSQPRIQALRATRESGNSLSHLNADDFLLSKEDYINKRSYGSILTDAVLDKENGWQDIGGDIESFKKFLDNCDDDELLTIVDCHV